VVIEVNQRARLDSTLQVGEVKDSVSVAADVGTVDTYTGSLNETVDTRRVVACGLRRHEVAELTVDHLQQREGHWAIVDLNGKGGHVRTVPVPDWVHGQLNEWTKAAGIETGKVFRRVSSAGRPWGEEVTEKLVWQVVKESAAKTGVGKLAPHDLRRYAECRIMPNRCQDLEFGA
jgi:integrase